MWLRGCLRGTYIRYITYIHIRSRGMLWSLEMLYYLLQSGLPRLLGLPFRFLVSFRFYTQSS